eukprot:6191259-Pleurochrysis_carterae.AAC.1
MSSCASHPLQQSKAAESVRLPLTLQLAAFLASCCLVGQRAPKAHAQAVFLTDSPVPAQLRPWAGPSAVHSRNGGGDADWAQDVRAAVRRARAHSRPPTHTHARTHPRTHA